jgi:hypothetical protein
VKAIARVQESQGKEGGLAPSYVPGKPFCAKPPDEEDRCRYDKLDRFEELPGEVL